MANLKLHCLKILWQRWNFFQSFHWNVHVGAKFFQPQNLPLKLRGNSPVWCPRFQCSWHNKSVLQRFGDACAIPPKWFIRDIRVMNWLRTHVGDVTLSPITEMFQHSCAVTETLQMQGETTFYWEKMKDYKFACICKWEYKMTEVLFNQSGVE